MPEISDKQGALLQNLRDAGCGDDMIATCLRLAKEKESDKLLRMLSTHRRSLLETVHGCHKEIDCLDYLVYTIEKQKETNHGL